MKRATRSLALLALAIFFGTTNATAASSVTWESAGFAEFAKGRFKGLTLSYDGILQPGFSTRWIADIGQPSLWATTIGLDGTVYGATGHSGKVIRVTPDGKFETLWSAPQPEIFAIASDRDGTLWAASSPTGALYRFTGAQFQEVWRCPEKYIWSIQPGESGVLYLGTGERGRIYRVHTSGSVHAELFYDTGQANVTALSLAPGSGRLLAGTEPNGVLYSVGADGRAAILYDSTLPEIRSIVPGAHGEVYVAAMGGALASRTATGSSGSAPTGATVVTAAPTVITVTENAQAGANVTPEAQKTAPATAPQQANTAPAVVSETAGVEKAAIYRIAQDQTVETLYNSKEENIYSLALDNRGSDSPALLFGTDNRGRVYRLQDGKITLLGENGAGEVTQITPEERSRGLLLGISSPARIIQKILDQSSANQAEFESAPHDCGNIARWGHVRVRPTSSGLRFFTRSGNSMRPDTTWEDWRETQDGSIRSAVGRYLQWRAVWPSSTQAPVEAVALSYLPQNGTPVVRSISASSVMGTSPAKTAATASSSTAAYSITVTDTGESAPASTPSAQGASVSRLQTTQTQITWQADDPDGDKLVYTLYFRPENAHAWQLIRSRMYENSLLLDPDVLADGRYLFRVVASDGPSNPEPLAKRTELVSAPVLVDNTPPLVHFAHIERHDTDADLVVEAKDETSTLRRGEYSLDGMYWQPVEAEDGITDTESERFRIHLEKLKPGEHVVVMRVFDAAGNAGLAKTLLQ